MPPKKQQVIESQSAVDPQVLQAIKIAIQPVVDSQTSMSRKIDEAMGQLTTLSGKVDDLESAAQAVDNRMETVVKEALPSITTHIESISSALAMRHLELEVHRRKWTLIIHGLEGSANEAEDETRAACLAMAKNSLRVPNADQTRVSACHRLGQGENSGIILRFTDLSERNEWLKGAQNLKGKDIKIAPDLPPILRQLKTDILNQRKELPLPVRKKSSVRYLKQWPFVKLTIKDEQDLLPRISKKIIVRDFLGFSPALELPKEMWKATHLAINYYRSYYSKILFFLWDLVKHKRFIMIPLKTASIEAGRSSYWRPFRHWPHPRSRVRPVAGGLSVWRRFWFHCPSAKLIDLL